MTVATSGRSPAPRPEFVVLRHYELSLTCAVGVRRQIAAMRDGRRRTAGGTGDENWLDDLRFHVMGACGEAAAAKLLGVYWSGSVDTFRTIADIGRHIEVRTARLPSHRLIVRAHDDPDAILVHVTLSADDPIEHEHGGEIAAGFHVWGSIGAREARQRDDWYQDPNGQGSAWFVPAAGLRPIGELIERVAPPRGAGGVRERRSNGNQGQD